MRRLPLIWLVDKIINLNKVLYVHRFSDNDVEVFFDTVNNLTGNPNSQRFTGKDAKELIIALDNHSDDHR